MKYGIGSKFEATKASSGLIGAAAFILVAGLGLLTAGLVPAAAGVVAGLAIVNAMAPGAGAILCAVLGGLAASSVANKYIKPPAALAALGLAILAGTAAGAAVGGVVGAIELAIKGAVAGAKKLFGHGDEKAAKNAAAATPAQAEQGNFTATTAKPSFTAAANAVAGNDNGLSEEQAKQLRDAIKALQRKTPGHQG